MWFFIFKTLTLKLVLFWLWINWYSWSKKLFRQSKKKLIIVYNTWNTFWNIWEHYLLQITSILKARLTLNSQFSLSKFCFFISSISKSNSKINFEIKTKVDWIYWKSQADTRMLSWPSAVEREIKRTAHALNSVDKSKQNE